MCGLGQALRLALSLWYLIGTLTDLRRSVWWDHHSLSRGATSVSGLRAKERDYRVGVVEALRKEREQLTDVIPGEVAAATMSDLVSSESDAVKGGLEDTLEAVFELVLAELTVICSHEHGFQAVEPGGNAWGFAVIAIEGILVAISGKGVTEGCSKAV